MSASLDTSWVVAPRRGDDAFDYEVYCPACDCRHGFNANIPRNPRWWFNENLVWPTLRPSVMISCKAKDGGIYVCHFLLDEGAIHYMLDSTHALAGKVLPLERGRYRD